LKLEGTYTFEAPQQVVWDALMDPDVLARVMPGCEKLEKIGENDYESVLKIKVGPVQGTFTGNVTLSELNAPHSYHMSVKGKGAPGHMTGEGEVRLEHKDGVTIMHYGGEAKIGGRLAGVGQRLMESSAKSLTHQGLEGLNHQIQARMKPAVTPPQPPPDSGGGVTTPSPRYTPPPAPPALSQTEFAMGVARHMVDDLIPPSSRPWLVAAAGSLVAVVALWWVGRRYERPSMEELGQQFSELREQQIKPAVAELGRQLAQLDERQLKPFMQQLSRQLADLDEQQVRPFVQEFSQYVTANFNEKKLRHLGKSLQHNGLGHWNDYMRDHLANETKRLAKARASLNMTRPEPSPAMGGVVAGLVAVGALAWWFFNRSSES